MASDSQDPRKSNRGRPVVVEQSLTDEESWAALRTFVDLKDKRGWTNGQTVKKMEEASRRKEVNDAAEARGLKCRFDVSETSISKFCELGDIPSPLFCNAFFSWMTIDCHDTLQEYIIGENLKNRDRAVSSIKEILGHSADLNLSKIKAYAGVFEIYRPSHINPNTEINVCKLAIGPDVIGTGKGSPFDCVLEHEWTQDGVSEKTVATGKVIPHENRLLAIMTTASKGSFIIMFDELVTATDQYLMIGMSGIMTAAAHHHMSAWPLYARRVDPDRFQHRSISAADWLTLPSLVQESLARGNIYWEYFTRPGFGLDHVRTNSQHGLRPARTGLSPFILAAANPSEPKP